VSSVAAEARRLKGLGGRPDFRGPRRSRFAPTADDSLLSGGWIRAIMPPMRKWLVLLLVLAVLYALPKINTRRTRNRYPLMKRIDGAINVVVVVLLAVYLYSFVRWLLTR
jgi:hypothetical protein